MEPTQPRDRQVIHPDLHQRGIGRQGRSDLEEFPAIPLRLPLREKRGNRAKLSRCAVEGHLELAALIFRDRRKHCGHRWGVDARCLLVS